MTHMAAGKMDFQLQPYSIFKFCFFLFRTFPIYTVRQITLLRRESSAQKDADGMFRVGTADQIQNRFCDGVSGLGIPEDPVVVAPGDIVDMDLPGHGKERIGVFFAEVPDFRSDIVFGEIHSRVQDKAAGALPKQFSHKIIEPAGGRLFSHSGSDDQFIAIEKVCGGNIFRHIDPVYKTVQAAGPADKLQAESVFGFRIDIFQ